ncbi:MAG TPA: CmpA/NrtA family ABC transporter substrate-binding protein [Roseiarcus sp.]|jgi:NitT/TauT family transport system ATP-binding protein
MTTTLRIGFLPLVDAALLVAAREEGFAEREGLSLELAREVSWANLRDRLSVGMLDAAQMLAPAAIAATLGLGHLRVPMAAPALLNMNGNSITLSSALAREMSEAAGPLDDVGVAATAFADLVKRRAREGLEPPVLASVFPFSMHTLLIDEFLRRGGLKAGEDVPLVVLPPPFMAASLASGQIDGFCAGAPWNALAVEAGSGAIVALGVDLIADAPEKLLVLRAAEAERRPETAIALTRAVLAAAQWAEDPRARARLAEYLSRPHYLDAPAATIEAILAGRLEIGGGRARRIAPDYLRIDRAALAPSPARADQVIEAMIAAGQIAADDETRRIARDLFRADLFAAAQA